MRVYILISAALLLSRTAAAGQKPISIDDMLAYDPPAVLTPVWAHDQKSFAYEANEAIYRYDLRHRKAKQWVELSALEKSAKPRSETKASSWRNRHASEQRLQWFPNSADLLVCVGGDLYVLHPNGEHELLSASLPPAEDPVLSPDGASVLFRSAYNLYVLDIESGKSKQLTVDGSATLLNGELDWVYPEELDLDQAAWWSPDSKRIAYLQFDIGREFQYPQADLLGTRAVFEPQRYPQTGTPNAAVKLGVLPAQGGPTVWMQAGGGPDSLLARVAWKPDSSALLLESMPRLQNRLDLLECQPATGEVKTLLHEESKDWINLADNLRVLSARPEFLWTSERSGFRHIYRYANNGKLIAQLTFGDWEVKEIVAVDEGNGKIYFTGSAETPLETQLYALPLAGGTPKRLTATGSNHDIRASASGHYLLDTVSSVASPPQCVLRNHMGDQLAVLKSDNEPGKNVELRTPEVESFRGPDGTTFYGKLIKPPGFDPHRKWPLIVHVYGGPGVQDVRNTWAGLDWDQVLAQHGFVIWHMDNRGSTGRGHTFETPVFRSLGQQEVADQRAGVEHLLAKGFIDPKRVGITGWSYGGFMTIHCMLEAPELFKTGVAGAPVTDFRNYDTIYTERYMGLPSENADGYDKTSNVRHAARLQGPLLMVHNFEDDNVLFQNTLQFIQALEEEDKPYSLAIYGQKTHHVAGKVQKQMYEQMTGFFDRNLK